MGGTSSKTTKHVARTGTGRAVDEDGHGGRGTVAQKGAVFQVPSTAEFQPAGTVWVYRGDGTGFAFQRGVKVVVVAVAPGAEGSSGADGGPIMCGVVERMAEAGLFGNVTVELVEVAGEAALTAWAIRHPLLLQSPDVAIVLDGVYSSWLLHTNARNVYIAHSKQHATRSRSARSGVLFGAEDAVEMMQAFVAYTAPEAEAGGGAPSNNNSGGTLAEAVGDWMAELPDELLLEVFRWLPVVDVVRAQRVCVRWARVAADASLFRTLVLRDQVAAVRRMPGSVALAVLTSAPSVHRAVQVLDVSMTDTEVDVAVAVCDALPALKTLVGVHVRSATFAYGAFAPLVNKGVAVAVAGYGDPCVMFWMDGPDESFVQYSSLAAGMLVDVDGGIKLVVASRRVERGRHPQVVVATINMLRGVTDLNTIVYAAEPANVTPRPAPEVFTGRLGMNARVLNATVAECTVAAIAADQHEATLTTADGRSFAMNCSPNALRVLAVGSPVDVYEWRGIRFGLAARTADAAAIIDSDLVTSAVFGTMVT